jgi:hypothetical protein
MEDDIYSLLMAEEPSAQQKAQAMAAALRQKRGQADANRNLSMLMSMGANPLTQGLAKSSMHVGDQMAGEAQHDASQLGQAGQYRLTNAMRKMQEEREGKQFGQQMNFNRYKFGQEMGLEREKMGLHREQAAAKAAADRAKQIGDTTDGLRKEFNQLPEVKSYKEVAVNFDKVKRSAANPSAAGDLGLIFGYMKLLDPGSGVKEGEFANAQNAGSVPTQIWNMYNRVKSGERLNPEQRSEFVRAAGDYVGSHEAQYKGAAERYRGLGEKAGANPDDIIALSMQPEQSQPEMVPMISPKGQPVMVPRARVDAALAAGGRLADGN